MSRKGESLFTYVLSSNILMIGMDFGLNKLVVSCWIGKTWDFVVQTGRR